MTKLPEHSKAPPRFLKGPKQSAAGRPNKKKPASLKNQIRAIERLIRKEGLDARIRKKEEVRLQQLREAAEAHKAQELERKYAVRYHKIRFFERVKFERRIKQLERELRAVDPSTDASGDLPARLAQAKDDLKYVVNFPKGEKYVSLLRNAEDPEAQKVLEAERTRIRAKVQQQMADIAIITQADEGNPQLRQQKVTPASPALQQDVPRSAGQRAKAQAPEEAAPGRQSSKRNAFSADQLKQLQTKSSKASPFLARQENADSSVPVSKASEQIAAVPAADGAQQKASLAAGLAEPDDIEEDDFFMSSSAYETDAKKQRIKSQPRSELPADMLHCFSPVGRHPASSSAPQKQGKQSKSLLSKTPRPGQQRTEQRHKQPAKVPLPPAHKPMKQPHKARAAAKPLAHGKLRTPAAGKPSSGHALIGSGPAPARAAIMNKQSPGALQLSTAQPHVKAATASKQSSAAAPAKPPGQPLRTRAEGGRRRRK